MNPFSAAQIALVAYAEVQIDGTSGVTNSGVTTTHIETGHYAVTLPTGIVGANPNVNSQLAARDLIFVQPMWGSAYGTFIPYAVESSVDDSDAVVKHVYFNEGLPASPGPADTAFKILVLRTVVPAVQSANGFFQPA